MTKMQTVKLVVAVVAALLLAVIVLQNTQQVTTRFLFIEVAMPLVVLQLITLVGGFVIGVLAAGFLTGARKRPSGK